MRIIDAVNSEPPLERPQGEWIKTKINADAFTVEECYKCSKCGYRKAFEYAFIDEPFCWHCGAQMKHK